MGATFSSCTSQVTPEHVPKITPELSAQIQTQIISASSAAPTTQKQSVPIQTRASTHMPSALSATSQISTLLQIYNNLQKQQTIPPTSRLDRKLLTSTYSTSKNTHEFKYNSEIEIAHETYQIWILENAFFYNIDPVFASANNPSKDVHKSLFPRIEEILTENKSAMLSAEYAYNSIGTNHEVLFVIKKTEAITVTNFDIKNLNIIPNFSQNVVAMCAYKYYTQSECLEYIKAPEYNRNYRLRTSSGFIKVGQQPNIFENFLTLPLESVSLPQDKKVIEIDVVFTDTRIKGLGTTIMKYFESRQLSIILHSLPNAYYFYVKSGFDVLYKHQGKDEYFTTPFLHRASSFKNQLYFRTLTTGKIKKHYTEETNNSLTFQKSSSDPIYDTIKRLMPNKPENIDIMKPRSDGLYTLVRLIKPPQMAGTNDKVKYKSRIYKIRSDRYGKFIITKEDGRVSLGKVHKLRQRSDKL